MEIPLQKAVPFQLMAPRGRKDDRGYYICFFCPKHKKILDYWRRDKSFPNRFSSCMGFLTQDSFSHVGDPNGGSGSDAAGDIIISWWIRWSICWLLVDNVSYWPPVRCLPAALLVISC